jgi:intein-encoded DNA endonuclease-like protein
MVMDGRWAVASRVASNEGLPKWVKYMAGVEIASIPAFGDGAGVLEGATPGPRCWETPDHVWRSDDARPRREGYLPRELRIKLYGDVVALRRSGLTYGRIVEEVYRRYGVRISKSSISEWLRGVHSPYNGRRIPSLELLKPSEELAYVIGVAIGDGYAYRRRRTVKGYSDIVVGLKARDREFVEEFGRCLAKVLGRRPIRPRYMRSSGRYVVEVESKTLYELLRKPVDLGRPKPYVEHCERCVAAFLRGFADSEGSVDKNGNITIYNTDLRLLTYVRELLRRLNIESTGPMLKARRGTIFYDPRTGKKYTRNKDEYYIYIRASSNIYFYRNVGFTITRKQARLENYVKRNTSTPTPPPTISQTSPHLSSN